MFGSFVRILDREQLVEAKKEKNWTGKIRGRLSSLDDVSLAN
jgi:hypothetical protein